MTTMRFGRAMQMVKGGFSHALREAGLKSSAVWQPSYYEHRVRDAGEYERMGRTSIRIRYAEDWRQRHPITHALPPQDQAVWTKYPRG